MLLLRKQKSLLLSLRSEIEFNYMYALGSFEICINPINPHRELIEWASAYEKEMAAHSSSLAWKIPRTEESDRLQSMGSQKSQT